MEKHINYFFEDTPETRDLMQKAIDEYMRIFKGPSFYSYSYSQRNKNASDLRL